MKHSSNNEENEGDVSDVFNFFHRQGDYSILVCLRRRFFVDLAQVFKCRSLCLLTIRLGT